MTAALATPLPISARQNAWNHLGTALPDVPTAAEALKFGRLNGWNLRKQPIVTHVGDLVLAVPGRFAVIRDNPFHDGQVDVLGDVGQIHKVMQNEQLERLLDNLAETTGARFVSAGEFDGGRRVFVAMKLPGGAKVGGVDQVDIYLSAMASHDGTATPSLMMTPVHTASQSVMNLAYKNADHAYKVSHTLGTADVLHKQANKAVDFAYDYIDGFEEEAARLVGTKLTQGKFEALIEEHYGAPAGADRRTVTRAQNKLDKMAELFADSFGTAAGQTAWAGLAALTEWHDFHSPVRRGDGMTEQEVRSRNALLLPAFKNTARKLMLAQA